MYAINQRIREILLEESQQGYRKFTASLIPGVDNILGVRLPFLRDMAKDIDVAYLTDAWDDYFEEVMLQGMVIGCAKIDIDQTLELTKVFVPKINNWSVCDSFCAGLKITKKNKELVFEFIKSYLNSLNEFEVRFAVVMLLDYYIVDEYISEILKIFDGINHQGYYVKMAIAWAISVCFVKYPDITKEYIETCKLDDFIINKAIQKTVESRRVSENFKAQIRKMKKI